MFHKRKKDSVEREKRKKRQKSNKIAELEATFSVFLYDHGKHGHYILNTRQGWCCEWWYYKHVAWKKSSFFLGVIHLTSHLLPAWTFMEQEDETLGIQKKRRCRGEKCWIGLVYASGKKKMSLFLFLRCSKIFPFFCIWEKVVAKKFLRIPVVVLLELFLFFSCSSPPGKIVTVECCNLTFTRIFFVFVFKKKTLESLFFFFISMSRK